MGQLIKKNKFLIFIFFLTVILRLPSLFEPYWYGDEGIYLALGQGLKKGLFLYRDIYDNKPPLIYLFSALAGNLFWLRFILFLVCLGSVYLMAKLGEIFFPKSKNAQKVSLLIFTLLLNIPLIEGNIANAEILQILPILGGIYLLFKDSQPRNRDYFSSGLLFAIAVLLKVPAVFDLLAVLTFLIIFASRKKLIDFNWTKLILIPGFLLPIFLVFLFFLLNRYLIPFFQIVFLQNLGYLSSWKTGSHQSSLLQSGLFIKMIILFAFNLSLVLFRKKFTSASLIFIPVWFSFSLLAALLSSRPYAHYLIQVLPSFCLLWGLAVSGRSFSRLLAVLLLAFSGLIYWSYHFWDYPVFPYYRNFLRFSLGQKSQVDYFAYFDPKVPKVYQLAYFLDQNTRPSDRVFIWGDEPYLFPLAKRLPASRFTVAYHIIDFNKFTDVAEELNRRRPEIIIFDRNKKHVFPALEILLETEYLKSWSLENFDLFRLRKN